METTKTTEQRVLASFDGRRDVIQTWLGCEGYRPDQTESALESLIRALDLYADREMAAVRADTSGALAQLAALTQTGLFAQETLGQVRATLAINFFDGAGGGDAKARVVSLGRWDDWKRQPIVATLLHVFQQLVDAAEKGRALADTHAAVTLRETNWVNLNQVVWLVEQIMELRGAQNAFFAGSRTAERGKLMGQAKGWEKAVDQLLAELNANPSQAQEILVDAQDRKQQRDAERAGQ